MFLYIALPHNCFCFKAMWNVAIVGLHVTCIFGHDFFYIIFTQLDSVRFNFKCLVYIHSFINNKINATLKRLMNLTIFAIQGSK